LAASTRYGYKRAGMWDFMEEWLTARSMPDDKDLAAGLDEGLQKLKRWVV
jgi:hypothetical protein